MFGKPKELTVLCSNLPDPLDLGAKFVSNGCWEYQDLWSNNLIITVDYGGYPLDGRASMSPLPFPRPSSRIHRSSLSPTGIASLTQQNLLAAAPPMSPVPTAPPAPPATQTVPMPLTSPAPSRPLIDPDMLKSLVGHHVLKVDSFNRDQLHCIFNLAQNYRLAVLKDRPLDYILRVRTSQFKNKSNTIAVVFTV